jgi:hypothetical protein
MEQVHYSLKNDMARLIRRTQLNRGAAVPLGDGESQKAPEYLECVYDDGDFYGQLLKTFIEASTTTSELGGARVMRVRNKRTLTRQEKRQRRLQADMSVQKELLNFMAPLASTQLPPMAAPLFESLFG